MRLKFVASAFVFVGLLSASTFAQEQEAPSRPPEVGPRPKEGPSRIRVGANVAAASLVTQVTPEYREIAKAAHISGTVVLHAIIGKDGVIQQLEFISGPPQLMKSAMDAVRQWRYRPTLLNSQPVEVDTTISVIYTIGKSGETAVRDNSFAQSDAPIDPQLKADIERLIDLSHTKENMVTAGNTMFEKLRPQVIASLPPTPNREKIVDAYSQKLVALLSSDDTIHQLIAVYAKYFSDDDVKGMIQFYETAAGQHYLANVSQFMADAMRIGQSAALGGLPGIMKQLCEEYPELQGEAKFCVQPNPEKKSLLIEPAIVPAGEPTHEIAR